MAAKHKQSHQNEFQLPQCVALLHQYKLLLHRKERQHQTQKHSLKTDQLRLDGP